MTILTFDKTLPSLIKLPLILKKSLKINELSIAKLIFPWRKILN